MILTCVLASLAALLHAFIWYLESFAWTTRARSVFGTSLEEAEATRELAFNQGFYNLFLALVAVCGVVAVATGNRAAGVPLLIAGAGSMLAAALVLGATSADKRGAALKQGAFPALALLALAIGV